ncbi:MAG: sulfite exporter TauE/SafE family protein [Helicobacteraceae bacterium]|nr:sulfite exporter TauE/SafE family protein [Helicobacteraceae bacterium]
MATQTVIWLIDGMSCESCQKRIERKLKAANGVIEASVSYGQSNVTITYDDAIISSSDLSGAIQQLGYGVRYRSEWWRVAGIFAAFAVVFIILRELGVTERLNFFPTATADMGYTVLFTIGLLTSLHCVAMCGGICLSQCLNAKTKEAWRSSLMYNAGRLISYTAVGAAVGAIGAGIGFNGAAKGIVQITAGIFMVIVGLNLLGILPSLRRFVPCPPPSMAEAIGRITSGKGPLVIGLLNGFMPCGPLQAMQLYALSTASAAQGAIAMFCFALGTLPLMFSFGALSAFLSGRFTRNAMMAGAALVVLLGITMFSNGWALSGLTPEIDVKPPTANLEGVTIENGAQIVRSTLLPGRYPSIVVREGLPVRWIIEAPKGNINGCNNTVQIPEYNITHRFKTGENIIEFTPSRSGKFTYSCWMGMIKSSITVVGDGGRTETVSGVEDTAPRCACCGA